MAPRSVRHPLLIILPSHRPATSMLHFNLRPLLVHTPTSSFPPPGPAPLAVSPPINLCHSYTFTFTSCSWPSSITPSTNTPCCSVPQPTPPVASTTTSILPPNHHQRNSHLLLNLTLPPNHPPPEPIGQQSTQASLDLLGRSPTNSQCSYHSGFFHKAHRQRPIRSALMHHLPPCSFIEIELLPHIPFTFEAIPRWILEVGQATPPTITPENCREQVRHRSSSPNPRLIHRFPVPGIALKDILLLGFYVQSPK